MPCDTTSLLASSKCFLCLSDIQLEAIKSYLWCQISNANPPTPDAPTNPDISADSTDGGLIVTWSQASAPGSNEVWKSVNGGAFSLLTSVGGAATQTTDVTVMPNNDFWTYKIRAVTGGQNSAFTSTVSATKNPSGLTGAVSYPDLVLVVGNFSVTNTAGLTSISLPLLHTILANFVLTNCVNITSVSCPKLLTLGGISGIAFLGVTSLATVNFALLTSTSGSFFINNSALTSISLPALVSLGESLDLTSNTSLATFSAPLLVSIGGATNLVTLDSLTTLTLTSLQTCDDAVTITDLGAIATLSFPALVSINGNFDLGGGSSLTLFTMPLLATVVGNYAVHDLDNLAALSLPALTSVGGNFGINFISTMASISIPVLTFTDATTIDWREDSLNAASINACLHRGVLSGTTSCTYDLSGGGNAAPTGQGIIDALALTVAGNTVTTN